MNFLRKISILLVCSLLTFSLFAFLENKKEIPHSTYYHQRASLFERLSNGKGEIIFLGDSITDGCEWSEIFQDLRIKNRGISGDVTEGILDRLREITESKPAKIFLMIGINDLARGMSVTSILSNHKKIIDNIIKNSPITKIYLQSLLPVNSDFGMFGDHTNKNEKILFINKRLKKMAEEYGVNYIDLYSKFAVKNHKLNPKYTNDGLHLTGEGYLNWMSMIESLVRE